MHTSQSSPLLIAEVAAAPGLLGLTLCPGKKDARRGWDRDLPTDIAVIRDWGASAVVTLIEDHEFALLQVAALGAQATAAGMAWYHLPIVDVSVPDTRFAAVWPAVGAELHQRLDAGERLLIHCRGGLGRTGLLAGQLLVERGMAAEEAVSEIRATRPGAIETGAQLSWVRRVQPRS